MADPVIEWYESTAATTPLSSHDYGTVDAGSESSVKTFFVYNNKGGTGASTATDVHYTTFDDADGGETEDVVTEKWLEVKIVSDNGTGVTDPDGGFKAVGGSTDANKKGPKSTPGSCCAWTSPRARSASTSSCAPSGPQSRIPATCAFSSTESAWPGRLPSVS